MTLALALLLLTPAAPGHPGASPPGGIPGPPDLTVPAAVAAPTASASTGSAEVTAAARRQSAGRRSEYRIEPRDILALNVEGQPDLTAKFEVDDDGAVMLPLVGRLVVSGLTGAELTTELARRLSDYVKNPQVAVRVERTERVFVFGEVASPGMYPLREHLTLLEVLARAGYKGPSEVLVVRADSDDRAAGVGVPDAAAAVDPARVERVNLWDLEKELERGALSRNLRLNDGDTVFVPRVDPNLVYVSGEVRKPGTYPVLEGTTVRQALTLAGGPSEQAALGRIRIVRLVGGRLERARAKLEDVVQPGDTVSVPETVDLPGVVTDVFSARNRLPLQLRLGNWLVVSPGLALRRIGIDTNALNSSGEVFTDYTASGGPSVDVLVDLGRMRLQTGGGVDFVYFQRYAGERAIDRRGSVGVEVEPLLPITLFGGWSYDNTRDRYSSEVDVRARRFVESRDAGLRVRFSQRLSVELAGRNWTSELAKPVVYQGVNLQETLTERTRTGTATVRYALTPLSALFVEGRAARHEFTYLPERDADEAEFSVGATFRPSAVISGEVRAGYLRYLALDPRVPDSRGGIARVDLLARVSERTLLGAGAGRSAGNSFRSQVPYAIIDEYGGSVRRLLFGRWDVFVESYRVMYRLKSFIDAPTGASEAPARETTQRYTAQVGVQVPGGARLAFDVTYWQRLTPPHDRDREYNALRMGLNVTYGAFQVLGR